MSIEKHAAKSSIRGLPFLKIVGTGNDFLFIDLRAQTLQDITKLSRSQVVARIAHRQFGVGSDGVVFIESNPGGSAPLKWDFYNPDGSRAAMCGNATRCMGRWAELQMEASTVSFQTAVGAVTVRKDGEEFSSSLTFLQITPRALLFSSSGVEKTATYLDTGVPHAVVRVDRLEDSRAMDSEIRALRYHPDTGPDGANVTFYQRTGEHSLRTMTFERGVEGFTLSCGTGVLAAAAAEARINSASPPTDAIDVAVETPGGALQVRFEKGLTTVLLKGPAQLICSGEITQGLLQ